MEEALDKNSNTEVLDLSYNGELDKVGKELKEKVTKSEVEAYLHINPPPPPADAPAPPYTTGMISLLCFFGIFLADCPASPEAAAEP